MKPSAGPARSASSGGLERAVERHVDERDRVAGRPRGLLRAAHREPEERVRDVRDHEPDASARRRSAAPGRPTFGR